MTIMLNALSAITSDHTYRSCTAFTNADAIASMMLSEYSAVKHFLRTYALVYVFV